MTKKPPPLTVNEIARRCGVTVNAIYVAMARNRHRKADLYKPLFDLGRAQGIGDGPSAQVRTLLKHEGVPGLKRLVEFYPTTQRGKFAQMILSSTDEAVTKAVAESEKLRKK